MILKKALRSRPDLLAIFRQLCQPDVLSGAVLVALRRDPRFAGIIIPSAINILRREHNCSAKQGGKRGPRAPIFYSVAGRRRASA